ncbi:hypothetical protein F4604DRAFT_1928754 [Suillus subluteus]|nr:hypothetical protein F4604DRAFT_1928754 [Suillus subluteus]
MSDSRLQLNCWFMKDAPIRIFILRIDGTELVEDLQELIKSKKSQLRDMDTDAIIPMKVLCDIQLNSDHSDLEFLDPHLESHEVQRLHPWVRLSEVFETQPKRDRLHIVVNLVENGELHMHREIACHADEN